MKKLLIIPVIAIVAIFAIAQEAKKLYDVRCPNCLAKRPLIAESVQTTASRATNINGIPGSMAEQIATFHCPECHFEFTTPIKPDTFIPVMPAVAVRQDHPGWPPPASGYAEELVRIVDLPDGSQYLVYHRFRIAESTNAPAAP